MGSTSRVPPGFRFHPTDEELVNYYLRKKVNFEKFDLDVIRDVDLNKLEPWDLHERCRIDTAQQTEWYFFSHKDKKYPTGTRTNRATAAGFWKATGRDKAVHTTCTVTSCPKRIGMRKTLVFYRGRAPHGQKTDWIMHEYRLEDGPSGSASAADIPPANEEGWVVCRVFKKRIHHQKPTQATSQAPLQASEEEQSSQDVFETANYNHDNYNSFQVNNAPLSASNCLQISCKKEDDYAENTLLQVPFLHMPQLESPKEYASADNAGLFHDLVDYHGKRSLIMGEPLCYKRPTEAFPSSFMPLGEMQTLDTESYTKSLIFGCENDNLVTHDIHWENDQWPSVLEILPKDMRYHHISGDTLSKSLLSANGDMDIWKPLL